jgi:hypothetical protein
MTVTTVMWNQDCQLLFGRMKCKGNHRRSGFWLRGREQDEASCIPSVVYLKRVPCRSFGLVGNFSDGDLRGWLDFRTSLKSQQYDMDHPRLLRRGAD